MTEPSDAIVLRWYWRHHVLHVEQHDSIEDAVQHDYLDSVQGEAASETIEVVSSAGSRRIEGAEVARIREGFEAEEAASWAAAPRLVASVEVLLDGKWAKLDSFRTAEEAEVERAGLVAVLGPRVRVVPAE